MKKGLLGFFFLVLLNCCFSQNAIVGSGFSTGWGGGSCPTGNNNFRYFSASAGTSYSSPVLTPNATGDQYWRFGIDWSGTTAQRTNTIGMDDAVTPGTKYTLNSGCTTSGALKRNVTSTNWRYIFKTLNAGTTPTGEWVFFEIQSTNVRSFTSHIPPTNVVNGMTQRLTATLDGTFATGQSAYVRYHTDLGFSNAIIAELTYSGSGNNYFFDIPAQNSGTTVTYYFFTSGSGLTINNSDADLFTINLLNNGGSNYSYTTLATPQTAQSGNWNVGATWLSGNVPPSGAPIIIDGHTVTLNSVSPTIGNLTFNNVSSKLSLNGNGLTINGAVTGAGSFIGTNSSSLTIAGNAGTLNFDQSPDASTTTTNGSNALLNLSFSGNSSAIIGAKLNLFGTLDMGNGNTSLNTDEGLLVFRNTATTTSRVAPITAGAKTFTGAVIVENYMNRQGRAWRLLSSPVTSAGSGGTVSPTIQSNWQSAMGYSSNYGTNIYSPAGGNGMDGTTVSNSLLRFDPNISIPSNPNVGGWENINSTTSTNQFNNDDQNANPTSANPPVFFLFVRGDKSVAPGVGTTFVPTTLASKGRITFGNKNVILVGQNNGYAAVGNPFISPVNLANVTNSNLTGTYWCWNPHLNPPIGNWVALNTGNSYTYDNGTPSQQIGPDMQVGQAALVRFIGGQNSGNVVFEEGDKATIHRTGQTGVSNGLQDNFIARLKLVNSDGTKVNLDQVFVAFKSNYNRNYVETEDAEKMNGSGENISSKLGTISMAIDLRPYIQNSDTVFMNFTNTKVANYEFEFDPSNFDATVLGAKLIDKFLNTQTPISLSSKTTVPFSVTATTGSNAADRFMIVFEGTGALPNKGFTLTGEKLGTNKVKINWEAQAETGVREYAVEKSTDGVNYQAVNTQAGKNGNATNVYTYTDNSPVNGVNYYRVKTTQQNDFERYSSVVTVNFKQQATNPVTVYPNPVKSNVIGVQLQNIAAGNYSIRLMSIEGKTVYSQQLKVSGTSLNTSLTPNTKLAQGTYTLQVVGKSTTYTQKVVVE